MLMTIAAGTVIWNTDGVSEIDKKEKKEKQGHRDQNGIAVQYALPEVKTVAQSLEP